MRPTPQLDLSARELVVPVNDRRVERRHQRRMQKIQEIGDRWPEPLNVQPVDRMDAGNNFFRRIAARAVIQQTAKGALMRRVLINVRYPQLWLPQKGMI